MRGKGFDFFVQGQPLVSSPRAVRKYEYKCPYPFQEQLEIMRHLHPFCQSAGDSELLDSRNRVWRLAAKKAMHFKGTASSWGGHFKEAIVVSCLSRRCYTLVRSIITTRRTMFMKVTGFLFRGFCGCKDEGLMYALLKRWDQGDISSNDVNERLKEEKASSRPVTEVETLKTENARLEAMVSQLQAEVRTLKTQLTEARRPAATTTTSSHYYTASPLPNPRSVVPSCTDPSPVLSASQVYTFDELDAEEESVLPVEPVMKRPRYTVCYKPSSESDLDLDDSREDPDWKEEKEEVTDDEDEADGDDNELNQAFISVKDWNPLNVQLKIEIPEKLQGNDQPPAESFMESEHQERELESVEENQSEINKSRPRRSASAKTDLMPGSEVIGLFRNGGRNKWEEWCECKVVDVLMNGELYNVVFTDGAKRFLKKTQIKKKD